MKLYNKLITILIFSFSLLSAVQADSQVDGKISGKVIDKKTGEELLGVTVVIEGTNQGVATDYEGKFLLGNLKPGTYNLVVSYVSYEKKLLKGVEVKPKEVTSITIHLEEATKELSEFVVEAELKKETASALLIQQKNSVSVSSGVSADLIRKTPDRTTADVIKRISGASVQDNKFAIIRGLSDRYNMGYLNGAPLPSTESDRKAFSLDIIPASVIDNMAIVKSATPDLPGDFAGGIIQINTKDIPSDNTISFNVAGQYNSITTFKSGISGVKSKTDWLGFDGGARQLPANLMATEYATKEATPAEKANQTLSFNNNFKANTISAYRPNLSLQFSASRRMKLFKNDLGVIFALSYNNSFRYAPFTTAQGSDLSTFNPQTSDGVYNTYDNYRNTVTSGAVLNFAYKIGKNTKLTFKNMLSGNAEDQTIHQTGTTYANNRQDQTKIDNYTYYYQSNRLLSSQFSAEHLLTQSKIKIKFTGGLNNIHREVPDYRRILYQSDFKKTTADTSFSDYRVSATGTNSFTPQNSGRYYSSLDEQMYSAGYDFSVPFKLSFLSKPEFKFGGMNIWRNRTFTGRNYLYSFDINNGDYGKTAAIDVLPADKVFADQNISATTHYIQETTQGTDSYDAISRLNAAYGMLDFKVLKRLRVIGGVRVEQFRQKLSWHDAQSGKPAQIDTSYVDFLPSINLVYELTEKTNLRASASKTLSRPEFREFAPMAFYEINYNAIIRGNPSLVKAQIYNYDLKFEYFPTAGQIFSINPFYKKFVNPVEAKNLGGTAGINNFSYINAAGGAVNYGVELEGKASFASMIGASTHKWVNNFSVFANLALIQSKVTLEGSGVNTGNMVNSRPLQGQSPYVFNAGMLYSDPKSKLDVNFTMNRIGRRLAMVNDAQENLIWENPRTVLDMSISKTFLNKLTTKITLGDILAQNLVFYQDLNANKKYDASSDVTTFNYRYGRTIQIYFGYTF